MKFNGWILAAAIACAPAAGLRAEVKGTPPDQWLTCFAATKLHQDALANSGKFSLNVVMQAGEPRLRYQRLSKAWLANLKKMDQEAASGEMVKAPAEMKKTKTAAEIEELAKTCILNLPDLTDPAFYAKYDFLGDDFNSRN
jgi:hypothetical protein